MKVKRKSNSASSISALAGLLVLFILSGCKSPPPVEDPPSPETTQVDVEPESVEEASADIKADSEAQTKPGRRGKKNKQVEVDVAENTGPGDGPPPADETKRKVKQMEQSLAPLEAVPAVPTS